MEIFSTEMHNLATDGKITAQNADKDDTEDKTEDRNIREEVGKDETDECCSICFAELEHEIERGVLNCCDHLFCFSCIMVWSKVESKCPMCKRRFERIKRTGGLNLKRPGYYKVSAKDQKYVPSELDDAAIIEPYSLTVCLECGEGRDESILLLCDSCDGAYHTYCVGLGTTVPRGNWFCSSCKNSNLHLNVLVRTEPEPSVWDLASDTDESDSDSWLSEQTEPDDLFQDQSDEDPYASILNDSKKSSALSKNKAVICRSTGGQSQRRGQGQRKSRGSRKKTKVNFPFLKNQNTKKKKIKISNQAKIVSDFLSLVKEEKKKLGVESSNSLMDEVKKAKKFQVNGFLNESNEKNHSKSVVDLSKEKFEIEKAWTMFENAKISLKKEKFGDFKASTSSFNSGSSSQTICKNVHSDNPSLSVTRQKILQVNDGLQQSFFQSMEPRINSNNNKKRKFIEKFENDKNELLTFNMLNEEHNKQKHIQIESKIKENMKDETVNTNQIEIQNERCIDLTKVPLKERNTNNKDYINSDIDSNKVECGKKVDLNEKVRAKKKVMDEMALLVKEKLSCIYSNNKTIGKENYKKIARFATHSICSSFGFESSSKDRKVSFFQKCTHNLQEFQICPSCLTSHITRAQDYVLNSRQSRT